MKISPQVPWAAILGRYELYLQGKDAVVDFIKKALVIPGGTSSVERSLISLSYLRRSHRGRRLQDLEMVTHFQG